MDSSKIQIQDHGYAHPLRLDRPGALNGVGHDKVSGVARGAQTSPAHTGFVETALVIVRVSIFHLRVRIPFRHVKRFQMDNGHFAINLPWPTLPNHARPKIKPRPVHIEPVNIDPSVRWDPLQGFVSPHFGDQRLAGLRIR